MRVQVPFSAAVEEMLFDISSFYYMVQVTEWQKLRTDNYRAMSIFLNLLKTAGLTILIETPVMILGLLREIRNKKLKLIPVLINSALVNLVTNLTMNTVLTAAGWALQLTKVTYVVTVTVLELLVYISECGMYGYAFKKNADRRKLYIVVFVANVVSLTSGFLL